MVITFMVFIYAKNVVKTSFLSNQIDEKFQSNFIGEVKGLSLNKVFIKIIQSILQD